MINGIGTGNEWKFAKYPPKELKAFFLKDMTASKGLNPETVNVFKKVTERPPVVVDKDVIKRVPKLALKEVKKPTLLTRLKRVPYVLANIGKQILKHIR